MKQYFVRVEVIAEEPSGQKMVRIKAKHANRLDFITDPEEVLTAEKVASETDRYYMGIKARETMQYLDGVVSLLEISSNKRDRNLADLMLPKIRALLHPFLANKFIIPTARNYNPALGSLNVDEISQHKPQREEADND